MKMKIDPLSDPDSIIGGDNHWFLECKHKIEQTCDCEKHSDCRYSRDYYLRKKKNNCE